MKRALIITSCGVVLALIIGAASHPKISAPALDYKFNICSDKETHGSECALEEDNGKKMRTEKFLRGLRFKARVAYV